MDFAAPPTTIQAITADQTQGCRHRRALLISRLHQQQSLGHAAPELLEEIERQIRALAALEIGHAVAAVEGLDIVRANLRSLEPGQREALLGDLAPLAPDLLAPFGTQTLKPGGKVRLAA